MNSAIPLSGPDRLRRPAFLVWAPVSVTAAWFLAALLSPQPLEKTVPFVLAQFALAVLLLWLLWSRKEASRAAGPDAAVFIALHGLLFYGLSNVVPVFYREVRPADLRVITESRVPYADIDAYTAATIAAIGLVAGLAAGAGVVGRMGRLPQSGAGWFGTVRWLPGAGTAAAILVLLLVLAAIGTFRFGIEFNATLSEERVARLELGDQLLFHGLFSFLPLGPALAATVFVQMRRCRWPVRAALLMAGLFMITLIGVWRMRSTAMLAAALPIVLLGLLGRIAVAKWFVPAGLLVVMSYVAVTRVRISEAPGVVESSSDTGIDLLALGEAVRHRGGDDTVSGMVILDASYRLAGLEGAAALLEAQKAGRLAAQLGRVTASGFVQSLPARIRPEPDIPLKIKTAPAVLGVFGEGDWVTTLLSEAVLDCGVWGTVLYGFLAGALIAGIEQFLLFAGSLPAMGGLLFLRYAFLLFLLTFASDLAGMTTRFFKATVGYWVLMIVIGIVIHAIDPREQASRSAGKRTPAEPAV